MTSKKKLYFIVAFAVPFLLLSGNAFADTVGQSVTFNTNTTFDKLSRKTVQATLRHMGDKAYFYAEDTYWNGLNFAEQSDLLSGIKNLASEFDTNIYTKETEFWGSESKPGVDGDNRITIFLEQLKSGHGGYFSTSNGYLKTLAPESNEREMIVVNIESVMGLYTKIFLAHEFQHLISFNQKEMLKNINEDVWLNELRSEYATTLVGYNEVFADSNLERRATTFFGNSSDSLVEWPNVNLDYALVSIFGEYVVDKYGLSLLKDTLINPSVGVASFNNVLSIRGIKERFTDIFGEWVAASYINDGSINPKLGYSRPDLKRFKASPQLMTTLSSSGSSAFSYFLKPWQLYGHKILTNGSLASDRAIKISPFSGSKFAYADNLGRFSVVDKDFYVTNPGGLEYFYIFPINFQKVSDFKSSEVESVLSLAVSYEDKVIGIDFGSTIKDGSLIKRPNEPETYVIEGKYKRYLRPEIIALYGHLIGIKPIEVNDGVFNSYTTSNYVQYVNEEQVYAVWPDGTKHWLSITPRQWDDSGRDWGAIFVINDLELNTYKTGAEITK